VSEEDFTITSHKAQRLREKFVKLVGERTAEIMSVSTSTSVKAKNEQCPFLAFTLVDVETVKINSSGG
jgi:hypothetical protein